MKDVTVSVGSGKKQARPLVDVLQAVISEMRGHVTDQRDSGAQVREELLERYTTAVELPRWQRADYLIFGV